MTTNLTSHSSETGAYLAIEDDPNNVYIPTPWIFLGMPTLSTTLLQSTLSELLLGLVRKLQHEIILHYSASRRSNQLRSRQCDWSVRVYRRSNSVAMCKPTRVVRLPCSRRILYLEKNADTAQTLFIVVPLQSRLFKFFHLSFLQLQPCTPSQSFQFENAVTFLLYQRIDR